MVCFGVLPAYAQKGRLTPAIQGWQFPARLVRRLLERVQRFDIMMLTRYHLDVRTTLTIDEDVAKLLDQEVRRSGDSFKGTVNRLLRLGLTTSAKPETEKPFIVKPFPLGIGAMLDRHNGSTSALL